MVKFIGEGYTYTDKLSGETVELIKDNDYNIALRWDGPSIIINGKQMFDDNGSFWIEFQDKNIQIPYAPSCLKKHWDVQL